MSADLSQAAAIRQAASEWIDALLATGLPTSAVASGVLVALIEAVIADHGPEKAKAWLQGQIHMIDAIGPQLQQPRG